LPADHVPVAQPVRLVRGLEILGNAAAADDAPVLIQRAEGVIEDLAADVVEEYVDAARASAPAFR